MDRRQIEVLLDAARIDSAPYLDQEEHEKARSAFEEDRAWLASRQS